MLFFSSLILRCQQLLAFNIFEQEKFHAQLSWVFFYKLGALWKPGVNLAASGQLEPKIYFEMSVSWGKRSWNENKYMKCVQSIFFKYQRVLWHTSVRNIESWLCLMLCYIRSYLSKLCWECVFCITAWAGLRELGTDDEVLFLCTLLVTLHVPVLQVRRCVIPPY